jgi:hypothetical protein
LFAGIHPAYSHRYTPSRAREVVSGERVIEYMAAWREPRERPQYGIEASGRELVEGRTEREYPAPFQIGDKFIGIYAVLVLN